jgi:hypothetical protein
LLRSYGSRDAAARSGDTDRKISGLRPPEGLLECRPMEKASEASGSPGGSPLDRKLCQVGGRNQNYVSTTGTSYHVQVEDLGPVSDRTLDVEVRRINVIVYANYGEPNARIVQAQDYDFSDIRTSEYNRVIEANINEILVEARTMIEERERREIARIKELLRQYYLTKDEGAKRDFELANAQFPFLFSRAWRELKEERAQSVPLPIEAAAAAAVLTPVVSGSPSDVEREVDEAFEVLSEEVLYPLDNDLRQKVLDIERMIIQLGRDLRELKSLGKADDILLQTCRKLVGRAKETISGRDSEFNARRLEMTANSLTTTWRQIRSRLKST